MQIKSLPFCFTERQPLWCVNMNSKIFVTAGFWYFILLLIPEQPKVCCHSIHTSQVYALSTLQYYDKYTRDTETHLWESACLTWALTLIYIAGGTLMVRSYELGALFLQDWKLTTEVTDTVASLAQRSHQSFCQQVQTYNLTRSSEPSFSKCEACRE